MTNQTQREIEQEIQLVRNFTGSYGPKLEELIARLNQSPAAGPDGQCLRLCVEAVNMVLSLQSHLATAIGDLSREANRQASA